MIGNLEARSCPCHGVKVFCTRNSYSVSYDGKDATPLRMPGPEPCYVHVMPHGRVLVALCDNTVWRRRKDDWVCVATFRFTAVCVPVDARTLMVTMHCNPRKHWSVDVFTGAVRDHAFPAFSARVRASDVDPPRYYYVADGVVALYSSDYDESHVVVGVMDVHSGDVLARYSSVWRPLTKLAVTPYVSVKLQYLYLPGWSVTVPYVDLHCSVRWMWIAAILFTT
jgi:hypothetical protein